jgi:hypothetical protein
MAIDAPYRLPPKSSPNRPLTAPPVRRRALHDPPGQLPRDLQPRTRARPPPARHRGRVAPEHAQPRLLARHRSPGLTPPSLHDAAAARRLLPDQLRETAGRSVDHAHSGRQSPARPSRARLRSWLGFEVMTAAGPTNGETCRLLLLLGQATSSNSSRRDPNMWSLFQRWAVSVPALQRRIPLQPQILALSRKKLTSNSEDFLGIYIDSTRIGYRRRFVPVRVVMPTCLLRFGLQEGAW